jgi:hypothetical protein
MEGIDMKQMYTLPSNKATHVAGECNNKYVFGLGLHKNCNPFPFSSAMLHQKHRLEN